MKRIVSTEYLIAAVVTAIFFVSFAGFEWWWLLVIFALVDVSMAGYLINRHVGALVYNIGHSFIGPAILMAVYVFGGRVGQDWQLMVAMGWLFHIFVDRALGYGLKHVEGFHHTHLGPIGQAKKKPRANTKKRS